MTPTRYRVRYRLSVAGGTAIEDVDGLYIELADHEKAMRSVREKRDRHLEEAERLIGWALARFPHSWSKDQCKDAARWVEAQFELRQKEKVLP